MELDQRKMRILRAIIDEYLLSANPVGSKALSRSHEFNLSPATIRNEMADLEDLGYLAQPHTSAGRIPSDKAYRLYVDKMLTHAKLSEDEAKSILSYCNTRVDGIRSVMKGTAKALSEITHYTAMVLMPELAANRLRHIQLVPLTEGYALLVVVTDAGVAKDAVVEIPSDMTVSELESISRQITARFYNSRMTTVADRIMSELGREVESRRGFVADLTESIRRSTASGAHSVELFGATNMLKYPEYSDVGKAQSFLAIVEGREPLYNLLKKASVLEFSVTIGRENEMDELSDCSVVTATYKIGDLPVGSFGVIGPTRMDYARVLSVLECMRGGLGEVLTNLLEED
ncbi:MAG: heat-inducible transcriptional repressor HrcA [Clostridia bacterium]|nr:heat-inducible transcriptional repressor HrcA [Clostridia bacterium]